MKFLNIGILAHVDAGKTSLTERLLFNAGVIPTLGSVDKGNAQTDSLTLERQRGITIKSAVTSFVANDTTINLIDTPGHPDFIAEVERVLHVLGGAILVVSAVEGVQAQTRILMRTLRRLRMPTLIFVNKIDRRGARYEAVLGEVADRLGIEVVAMGETQKLGTASAKFIPHSLGNGQRATLAEQTKKMLTHPVFFGSAITGAGVASMIEVATTLLPLSGDDVDGEARGSIFKIERSQGSEKIAYVSMFSGKLRVRDRIHFGNAKQGRITAMSVFARGASVQRSSIVAGQIGKVWGLGDAQIGDTIGATGAQSQHYFAPPTFETVVLPRHSSDKGRLRVALDQLAEQDPLINVRQDDIRQEIYLSLYGEVQKEIIEDTLAHDFGLEVTFRTTTTVCIERPITAGEAVEIGKRHDPFLATVGLRVEPLQENSGVKFVVASQALGQMPAAFYKAVEETVHATLRQGLHGWQVTDCTVTLTHADYFPRQSHSHARFDKSMSSTGADFRGLTPLVLMSALQQSGTVVCEPMHHFELEIPGDVLSAMLPILAKLGAVPTETVAQKSRYVLEGNIPAAQVYKLQQQLPTLTRGEGVLECRFERYQPILGGGIPARPRTDFNPLDRKEYMLHIAKRA